MLPSHAKAVHEKPKERHGMPVEHRSNIPESPLRLINEGPVLTVTVKRRRDLGKF